jgi:hypothetical protein
LYTISPRPDICTVVTCTKYLRRYRSGVAVLLRCPRSLLAFRIKMLLLVAAGVDMLVFTSALTEPWTGGIWIHPPQIRATRRRSEQDVLGIRRRVRALDRVRDLSAGSVALRSSPRVEPRRISFVLAPEVLNQDLRIHSTLPRRE